MNETTGFFTAADLEAVTPITAGIGDMNGDDIPSEGRIAALEARVRELEATLAAVSESLEAALASRSTLESERDTIKAECDRLRGLVREAVSGLKPFAALYHPSFDNVGAASVVYSTLGDLRHAAALVARLGAE